MQEFELHPGEHFIRESRMHWFVFAAELLPYFLLALLPFIIPAMLRFAPSLITNFGGIDFAAPIARTLIGTWILIIWTTAWGSFTRYFLHAWILTDQRLVDIEQHAFFRRKVSSILLNRVQDVTTNVHGIINSLLCIGKITVQSAGAKNEFTMLGIPNPEEMRDLIIKYIPEEPPEDGTGPITTL